MKKLEREEEIKHIVSRRKNNEPLPGGSAGWNTPNDCEFVSQSGHIPKLQVQILVRGADVSFSPPLPSSVSKISKQIL